MGRVQESKVKRRSVEYIDMYIYIYIYDGSVQVVRERGCLSRVFFCINSFSGNEKQFFSISVDFIMVMGIPDSDIKKCSYLLQNMFYHRGFSFFGF